MNVGAEFPLLLKADHKILGSEYCSGYSDLFGQWNTGFYCPQSESKTAVSCCGTSTFKYCCTINEVSSTASSADSGGEDSSSSADLGEVPFFVRSPILSGVVTGFFLVIVFIVIGSCYFYSCCLFSKKQIFSPGFYQIPHNSSSSSRITCGSINTSSLNNPGRLPTQAVIQSMVVCTDFNQPKHRATGTERHLPLLLYDHNHDNYSGSSRNRDNMNMSSHSIPNIYDSSSTTSKAIHPSASSLVGVGSNYQTASSGPLNPNLQNLSHHFQNINQDVVVPDQHKGGCGMSSDYDKRLDNPLKGNSPAPPYTNTMDLHLQQGDYYYKRAPTPGPELLLHCPLENVKRHVNYSAATLPSRKPNSYYNSEMNYNKQINPGGRGMNYYSATPPPSYENCDNYYYDKSTIINEQRPYNTLNLPRSSSANSGTVKHKSILKKPGRIASDLALHNQFISNYSGSNDSATETDPELSYSVLSTQPDIIQTRCLNAFIPARDSPNRLQLANTKRVEYASSEYMKREQKPSASPRNVLTERAEELRIDMRNPLLPPPTPPLEESLLLPGLPKRDYVINNPPQEEELGEDQLSEIEKDTFL